MSHMLSLDAGEVPKRAGRENGQLDCRPVKPGCLDDGLLPSTWSFYPIASAAQREYRKSLRQPSKERLRQSKIKSDSYR